MESETAVDIRPLQSMSEYRECVKLQEEIWGCGFSERVPIAILKVSQRLGGVVAGAYDWDGTLAGFVFGMTGWEEGKAVHWSDMLAVRPEMRGTGVGRRLKEFQRQQLLAMGVDLMYWTFEPLESRNAYLNVARLGVVVKRIRPEHVRRNRFPTAQRPRHRPLDCPLGNVV